MNAFKYLLKIKRKINNTEKFLEESKYEVNNPFMNVKPKTYVWIEDERTNRFRLR